MQAAAAAGAVETAIRIEWIVEHRASLVGGRSALSRRGSGGIATRMPTGEAEIFPDNQHAKAE
jgi:hypothetical protein